MRPRHTLALLLLAGCVNPGKGRFPTAGADPADIHDGDVAFTLDAGEDYWRPHKVKEHNDHQVLLSDFATYKWIAPMSAVVAPAQVRAGDWFRSHGAEVGAAKDDDKCDYKEWLLATAATATTVSAQCGGRERTWEKSHIGLPRAGLFGSSIVKLAGSAVALLLAAWAFALFARRRARAKERLADAEVSASTAESLLARGERERGRAESRPAKLAVLRCSNCDEVVPLAAAATARCRACGADVAMPPEYQRLVTAREEVVRLVAVEAGALRRAQVVTNPATGVVLLAVGAAWWLAYRAALARGLGDDLSWGVGFFLYVAPLLLAMVAVALYFGGGKFTVLVRPLVAPRDDKQRFVCRGCGAPLGRDSDGVTICDYCHAQNVISARLAASARAARSEAAAHKTTVAAATEVFWSTLWRIWGIPGMLVSLGFAILMLVMILLYASYLW